MSTSSACPIAEAIDFDWRKVLHPDDLPQVLQQSVQGEASLKPFVLEARCRNAAGEWRWLRSESQPRWDPTGKHIGFIGVAHDITAAKQAEIELRQLGETLEERIAERTAELEIQRGAAARDPGDQQPVSRAWSISRASCSTPTRPRSPAFAPSAHGVIGKPFWDTPLVQRPPRA